MLFESLLFLRCLILTCSCLILPRAVHAVLFDLELGPLLPVFWLSPVPLDLRPLFVTLSVFRGRPHVPFFGGRPLGLGPGLDVWSVVSSIDHARPVVKQRPGHAFHGSRRQKHGERHVCV